MSATVETKRDRIEPETFSVNGQIRHTPTAVQSRALSCARSTRTCAAKTGSAVDLYLDFHS